MIEKERFGPFTFCSEPFGRTFDLCQKKMKIVAKYGALKGNAVEVDRFVPIGSSDAEKSRNISEQKLDGLTLVSKFVSRQAMLKVFDWTI